MPGNSGRLRARWGPAGGGETYKGAGCPPAVVSIVLQTSIGKIIVCGKATSFAADMTAFTFSAGKSALITGGASGIGFALAQRCIRAGMKVLIADNNAESLESAKKGLGGDVTLMEMDVSKTDAWAGLQDRVGKEWQGS